MNFDHEVPAVGYIMDGTDCWMVRNSLVISPQLHLTKRGLWTTPETSFLSGHIVVTNFSLCALSVLWLSVEFCDRFLGSSENNCQRFIHQF